MTALSCHPEPLNEVKGKGLQILRGACPERSEILRYPQNDMEGGTQNDKRI